MNNKGFTLTELLATVVVLAILIAIAIPSYFAISNNTKRALRDEKLELIRIKAIQYAEDHDIEAETISVSRLINDGYLASDSKSSNEFEQMVNPYPEDDNDKYLDCYLVDVIKENGEYKATVNKNNDCSYANLDIENSKLNIEIYAYDSVNKRVLKKLGSNNITEWTRENVLLFVNPTNIGNIEYITWGSGTNTITKNGVIENQISSDITPNEDAANIFIVSATTIINSQYRASAKTSEGIYSRNAVVRIDKEKPTVDAQSNSEWLNDVRRVVLIGSDGNGSGIYRYYISTNINDKPTADSLGLQESNVYELSEGTYYAYAIDNVGNVSDLDDKSTIIVDNIAGDDSLKCDSNISSLPSDYVNYDVRLTYGCKSSTVGCKTQMQSKVYTETKSETITWTIEDNIGNKKNCSLPVNIKIDKTKPDCTNSNFSSWTKEDRTITYGCVDNGGSGCETTTVNSTKYTTSTKDITIPQYEIRDKAGNSRICPSKTVHVYIDKEDPKCTVSGAKVNAASDVTLVGTCSDSYSGCKKEKVSTIVKQEQKAVSGTYSPGIVEDNVGHKTTCESVFVSIQPKCSVSVGTSKDFEMGATNYTIPCDGTYEVKLYGAQGGGDGGTAGGKGAYLAGRIHLTKGTTVVFTVGGKGETSHSEEGSRSKGGYNGGGSVTWSGAGGGRTDIKINGVVYAAAAGGGGATHGIKAIGGRISTETGNTNSSWEGQSGYGAAFTCGADVGGGGAGYIYGGIKGVHEKGCGGGKSGYGGISGYRSEFIKTNETGEIQSGHGKASIKLVSIG